MTLPPLQHGRDPRGGGPGGRLRRAYTFLGVTLVCALIGFYGLRLAGVERGEMSLPAALLVVAVAAAVAAVLTATLRRRR